MWRRAFPTGDTGFLDAQSRSVQIVFSLQFPAFTGELTIHYSQAKLNFLAFSYI